MENRARLIEAAADLFYCKGYEATSVEELLAATGIARSNFYYHFANKLELAREVVGYWIAEYDSNLVESTLGDRSFTPAERLRRLFACADGSQDCAAGRSGCPLGALAVELAQQDGDVQAVLSDYFTRLQEQLTDTIMEGVARGEFKTARPSEAARLALTVLEGALLLSRTHQRPRQVSPAGLALVTLLEGRDSEFRSTSEKSE